MQNTADAKAPAVEPGPKTADEDTRGTRAHAQTSAIAAPVQQDQTEKADLEMSAQMDKLDPQPALYHAQEVQRRKTSSGAKSHDGQTVWQEYANDEHTTSTHGTAGIARPGGSRGDLQDRQRPSAYEAATSEGAAGQSHGRFVPQ